MNIPIKTGIEKKCKICHRFTSSNLDYVIDILKFEFNFTTEIDCYCLYNIYDIDKVIREVWLRNGTLHKNTGPAYTRYNSDGTIFFSQYWKNGIKQK